MENFGYVGANVESIKHFEKMICERCRNYHSIVIKKHNFLSGLNYRQAKLNCGCLKDEYK